MYLQETRYAPRTPANKKVFINGIEVRSYGFTESTGQHWVEGTDAIINYGGKRSLYEQTLVDKRVNDWTLTKLRNEEMGWAVPSYPAVQSSKLMWYILFRRPATLTINTDIVSNKLMSFVRAAIARIPEVTVNVSFDGTYVFTSEETVYNYDVFQTLKLEYAFPDISREEDTVRTVLEDIRYTVSNKLLQSHRQRLNLLYNLRYSVDNSIDYDTPERIYEDMSLGQPASFYKGEGMKQDLETMYNVALELGIEQPRLSSDLDYNFTVGNNTVDAFTKYDKMPYTGMNQYIDETNYMTKRQQYNYRGVKRTRETHKYDLLKAAEYDAFMRWYVSLPEEQQQSLKEVYKPERYLATCPICNRHFLIPFYAPSTVKFENTEGRVLQKGTSLETPEIDWHTLSEEEQTQWLNYWATFDVTCSRDCQ